MTEILDVGDEVPNFNLDSQLGMISFREIIDGRWCLLVTFRTAFDPVATTDIAMMSKMFEEFESRNIFPIAIGNDSVTNIRKWITDIEDIQNTKVKIPIVSDPGCKVLEKLGCAKISADKRIRSSMRYSPSMGRNFYETLRLFDGLQLVGQHRIVCPSNWGIGQDVMLSTDIPEDEQESNYRFVEVRPWFKLTPCPES